MPPATASPAARPLADRLRCLALPLLLAAFILLGTVYAVVTPLFEVSDELWHYPMVKTLADGQGLPVQDPANPGPWRQEGSQPPLYYAVMALATSWIDTSDMAAVRWVNPHADNGLITADGNNNILIHTAREQWPWTGTVLAVRLIRILSVLLAAGTVYCTYRLALEALPGRGDLALAAAGFVAFTPMFVFISASVNNDTLAITLSTATLWLMARWVCAAAPPRPSAWVVMGALLGGAALSKSSALGLWPLAALALVAGELLRAPGGLRAWRALVRALLLPVLVMYAVALALSGWWFVRNFQLYGDWLGWNAFLAVVGARPHPATLLQLWGERVGFVQAYWGLFGGVSVPLPGWVYTALTLLAGAALLGLIIAAVSLSRGQRAIDQRGAVVWGLLLAHLSLVMVGLLRWTSLTWASQGRLVFPAIAVVSLLLAAGLARLWRGLPALAVAALALLTAMVPFTVIAPHYAPPPPLTAGALSAIPHPLSAGTADFGGELRLLGYDVAADAAQPGQVLRLTLYWQSLIAMDRNWSIFVHVVDDAGVILAQRDRYPGQGALATTLLPPGATWADAYVIPIPEAAYAPVSATLQVGLYDLADGARAPLADGAEALVLAPVSVLARPLVTVAGLGPIPNPFGHNFANQIELVGYDLDRRSLRPGETLRVTLFWRALRPVAVNYSVFVHVRGLGETLWGGQDGWPQQGDAPTSTWRAGDVIRDIYAVIVKPDTPPGQYDVEVGLYDAAGVRLQALADDGRPTDLDFVYLSRVRVTP
ncbi:MAG: glycosyltransferase family 39 protein [Anaerolineales bacterium]|nr:glycosyltransferase family 39 protein [Anaerolineales bacterium]